MKSFDFLHIEAEIVGNKVVGKAGKISNSLTYQAWRIKNEII